MDPISNAELEKIELLLAAWANHEGMFDVVVRNHQVGELVARIRASEAQRDEAIGFLRQLATGDDVVDADPIDEFLARVGAT